MNLIDKIKLDDENAFDEAFNLHHKKLYYYVLSKTKSAFQAEEVVQLTFIKLWQYRHSLNVNIPLAAQIFRIAKTTIIDQFRKLETAEHLISELKKTTAPFEFNNGPVNIFEQELSRQLQMALSTMPPVRKKVFELSRFQGLTYKEIAAQLSISVKTVENHINLALKHVRNYFPLVLFIVYIIFDRDI